MNTMPLHLTRILTPVLFSLAVSQACALEVVRIGADGAAGAPGAQPSGPGGDGVVGESVDHSLSASDALNRLTVTGGTGGNGGYGVTEMPWPGDWPPVSQPGGTGAAGGTATGWLTAVRSSGPVSAETIARGGDGGQGGHDGCCTSGMAVGGAGASAASTTRAGTGAGNVLAVARATGGNGGVSLQGGAASANASGASASGDVTGLARADGGHGGDGQPGFGGLPFNPGNGGNANAALVLTATGMAAGRAEAVGGRSGGAYPGPGLAGTADAALELHGAGATGVAHAVGGEGRGGGATSAARALTTGASVVDLTALAEGGVDNAGAASVYVDAGYGGAAAGNALVSGQAVARGGPYGGLVNTASVNLFGSGAIVGVSEARGNDGFDYGGCYAGCAPGGSAYSTASGVTRGSGNVTLTALAVGGASVLDGTYLPGGTARAVASGQSGSGVVNVRAEARSPVPYVEPQSGAFATARTLEAGGSSRAEAQHIASSVAYSARADAASVGSGGAQAVAIGQGASGTLQATANATADDFSVSTRSALVDQQGNAMAAAYANVGGKLYTLPAADGAAGVISYASGAPSAAALSSLLVQAPTLSAQGARVHWMGAGALGAVAADTGLTATTGADYGVRTSGDQRLLLGLFGGQSVGTTAAGVDFSVINNGVTVYTRYVNGDELTAFFSDRLLDLGVFAGGWQDIAITAAWSIGGAGSYGFHYALGVSAVPEPSTWMALLLGLGTLALVARRRQQ
ncbi:MAG: PEP-CTERM sorting domain-containing protein [Duganella sp.]